MIPLCPLVIPSFLSFHLKRVPFVMWACKMLIIKSSSLTYSVQILYCCIATKLVCWYEVPVAIPLLAPTEIILTWNWQCVNSDTAGNSTKLLSIPFDNEPVLQRLLNTILRIFTKTCKTIQLFSGVATLGHAGARALVTSACAPLVQRW